VKQYIKDFRTEEEKLDALEKIGVTPAPGKPLPNFFRFARLKEVPPHPWPLAYIEEVAVADLENLAPRLKGEIARLKAEGQRGRGRPTKNTPTTTAQREALAQANNALNRLDAFLWESEAQAAPALSKRRAGTIPKYKDFTPSTDPLKDQDQLLLYYRTQALYWQIFRTELLKAYPGLKAIEKALVIWEGPKTEAVQLGYLLIEAGYLSSDMPGGKEAAVGAFLQALGLPEGGQRTMLKSGYTREKDEEEPVNKHAEILLQALDKANTSILLSFQKSEEGNRKK